MRIAVIGNGVVGHATARCYMENHEVRIWDQVDIKSTHSLPDVLGMAFDWVPEIVFVCLPESTLDEFFSSRLGGPATPIRQLNFVLKSTVPIGKTRELCDKYRLKQIVHSPEFLTERRAVVDVLLPARNIIGWTLGCYTRTGVVSDFSDHMRGVVKTLGHLYVERFPGIPIHVMTSDESEAVKLMTNAFFGVKIAFFNEMHGIASSLKLDWSTVLAGILSDGRISHSHTTVPGPDGKFGFGGKCLPKDLEMLLAHVNEAEREVGVCAAAAFRNKAIDRNRPAQ